MQTIHLYWTYVAVFLAGFTLCPLWSPTNGPFGQVPAPPPLPSLLSLSPALESCVNGLVSELPLAVDNSNGRPALVAHHWLSAARHKWNENIRFAPLPALLKHKIRRVVYPGGNTEAADIPGIAGLAALPSKVKFDVLEPVPSFFSQLELSTASKYAATYNITLHKAGFAKEHKTISLPKSALEGQATHIGSDSSSVSSEDAETLVLLRPDEFLQSLEITAADFPLLHANCEGCEYDMLEALIDTDSLKTFAVLQFSFHVYTSIDNWFTRYCKIRVEIEKDFVALEGQKQSFGWERWIRRDLMEEGRD